MDVPRVDVMRLCVMRLMMCDNFFLHIKRSKKQGKDKDTEHLFLFLAPAKDPNQVEPAKST